MAASSARLPARSRSSSNCCSIPVSFKARGAFANLLTREIPTAGIVAASGGNHGAAVAYAAMRLRKAGQDFRPRHFLAGQDRAHPRIRRRPRRRRRRLCRGTRRQRGLGAADRRDAGPGIRPERNHHRPGHTGARTRGADARYRHRAGFCRRRRTDLGHRRLVRRPHQGHRRRTLRFADADQRHWRPDIPSMPKSAGSRRIRWRPAGSATGFFRSCRNTHPAPCW